MKITSDIIRHEFIGTEGKIIKSPHADYVGMRGEVVDETKNTFTIMYKGKAKRIVKNLAVFNFKFSDGTVVEIDGKVYKGAEAQAKIDSITLE